MWLKLGMSFSLFIVFGQYLYAQPNLSWLLDTNLIDYGNIKTCEGVNKDTSVKFINKGNYPLIIERFSCNYSGGIGMYPKKSINPGDTVDLSMKLTFPAHLKKPYSFHKSFLLRFKGIEEGIDLLLTGTIVNDSTIIPKYSLSDSIVYFSKGVLKGQEVLKGQFNITNMGNKPFEVEGIHYYSILSYSTSWEITSQLVEPNKTETVTVYLETNSFDALDSIQPEKNYLEGSIHLPCGRNNKLRFALKH